MLNRGKQITPSLGNEQSLVRQAYTGREEIPELIVALQLVPSHYRSQATLKFLVEGFKVQLRSRERRNESMADLREHAAALAHSILTPKKHVQLFYKMDNYVNSHLVH